MKESVINMVPQLTNQQRPNLLSPSPHGMLHTQPLTNPYQEALLFTPLSITNDHAIPSKPYATVIATYQHTTSIYPTTIHSRHPPSLPPSQTSTNSNLPQSQTSFENKITAIDADL